MKTYLCSALLSIVIAFSAAGQAVTVDFNNPSDLLDNFNIASNFGSTIDNSELVNIADGGVAGSGSVRIGPYAPQNQLLADMKTGIGVSVGVPISVSILQKTASTFATSNYSPYLYLNAANNTAAVASPHFTAIGIGAYFNGSTTTLSRFSYNDGSATGGLTFALNSSSNLATDHWYRITMIVTLTGGGSYSLDASIDDFGADGTGFVSNILTGSTTDTVPLLSGVTTLYPAFGGDAYGNATNLDNFTVATVPEPSSLALVLAGGAMLAFRARKFRR
jgi:hypothetical protein